jgi:hypothetical protein
VLVVRLGVWDGRGCCWLDWELTLETFCAVAEAVEEDESCAVGGI